MVTMARAPMTDEDRDALRRRRPSFVFPRKRRHHREELEQNECERYVAHVRRAWDLTECVPTCCPNAYLLDVGGDRYLLVESWEHLAKVNGAFPGAELEVRCSVVSGQILSIRLSGPPVPRESTSLRDIGPELGREGCVMLAVSQLSPEVRAAVGAG